MKLLPIDAARRIDPPLPALNDLFSPEPAQ